MENCLHQMLMNVMMYYNQSFHVMEHYKDSNHQSYHHTHTLPPTSRTDALRDEFKSLNMHHGIRICIYFNIHDRSNLSNLNGFNARLIQRSVALIIAHVLIHL